MQSTKSGADSLTRKEKRDKKKGNHRRNEQRRWNVKISKAFGRLGLDRRIDKAAGR